MFEFDLSKIILFGVVALLVVGPNELPAALRTAGRMMAKIKQLKGDVRKAADTLMADATLDRELDSLSRSIRTNLALDPMTAMRGSLPASGAKLASAEVEAEAMEYASPEMRAYLAPLDEVAPIAEGEVTQAGAQAAGVC
jgi:sec-independent protein translocase protein TatB